MLGGGRKGMGWRKMREIQMGRKGGERELIGWRKLVWYGM